MNKERLIPLIVATALFMENMDSTVIATSLPAIAADIGASPLTLKLAITSYLLSLAVFIPASGWTADRFGARMVFSLAVAVFMVGSIGCALSSSVTQFVIARIVQGFGGAMMTPVGRLVLLRSIDKSALVSAMAWVTVPAGFPLHIDREYRMRRGHQQQDVENQPEKRAKYDQDQVENRRKRLPVEQQAERRQQGSNYVNHHRISGIQRDA